MNKINAEKLAAAVRRFALKHVDYYKQWMFDRPLFVSPQEDAALADLQKVMYKMIHHFGANYDQYAHLMPVSAKAQRILDIFSHRDYHPGTYRTDFVYDPTGQMKIIEITCRFGLNGIFSSSIVNLVTQEYQKNELADVELNDRYQPIFQHLANLIGNAGKLVVLLGEDRRNESKMYGAIFEDAGFDVVFIPYQELNERSDELDHAFIVSELALEEIEELSDHLILKLSKSKLINDMRTVFLIHDKRFFDILGNEDLRKAVLTEKEEALFDRFYIPTYAYGQRTDQWALARSNKENWIIKHRSLGKSQQVYAGVVTSPEVWEKIFLEGNLKNMVLQAWIPQRKISDTVNGVWHEDYITGTAIFFDDHYFGLGIFRTSSYPVTNVIDDRKRCGFILKQQIPELLEEQFLTTGQL